MLRAEGTGGRNHISLEEWPHITRRPPLMGTCALGGMDGNGVRGGPGTQPISG